MCYIVFYFWIFFRFVFFVIFLVVVVFFFLSFVEWGFGLDKGIFILVIVVVSIDDVVVILGFGIFFGIVFLIGKMKIFVVIYLMFNVVDF